MEAIASGDDNGWLSTYNDDSTEQRAWATFPSVQMHEISHNIGLGHSGKKTDCVRYWFIIFISLVLIVKSHSYITGETDPNTGVFFDRGDLSGVMGTSVSVFPECRVL